MKYIGFYSNESVKKMNLDVPLAAKTKMSYIARIIEEELGSCEIISSAPTAEKRGWFNRRTVSAGRRSTLEVMATFGCGSPILKKVQIIFSQFGLLLCLLRNTRKNENVLVYHSLYLMIPVWIAMKLKKFNLILEMEELYSDVLEKQGFIRTLELKYCRLGKAYLFPTAYLKKSIGMDSASCAVIHGTYQIPQKQTQLFEDGKIHLVYAGTLDPRKGCMLAAKAASYLPCGYHIHILGFGTDQEKKNMKSVIDSINMSDRASVSYDGVKTGQQYTAFIQSCSIGLCTQIPEASFSDTSFPSKILSYICNGLRVVSIRIPTVEKSAVGDLVYFYDEPDAEKIADTVLGIHLEQEYDGIDRIKKLDQSFRREIKALCKRCSS